MAMGSGGAFGANQTAGATCCRSEPQMLSQLADVFSATRSRGRTEPLICRVSQIIDHEPFNPTFANGIEPRCMRGLTGRRAVVSGDEKWSMRVRSRGQTWARGEPLTVSICRTYVQPRGQASSDKNA